MGLLDDYGLDLDEVEAPSWDIADGAYEFVIGDLFIKNGSNANPDKSWIIIEYLVGESGKRFSELYQLPVDAANPTDGELMTLGRYKSRVISFGFDESEVNNVDRDSVVGITGTFQLRTTKGKNGGLFQNIRNLKVTGTPDDGGNAFAPADAAEEAPAGSAKTTPAARKTAAASATPKAAAPKAPTAVSNPFANR